VGAPLGERLESLGFFERRQVLALDVLDQGDLDDLVVVYLADDDWDLANSDLDGRLVASLTGDDLEPAPALSNDDRLDDAFLGNRRHQLRQVAHDLARLVRIGIQLIDGGNPSDGRSGGARERFDVMFVVPHAYCLRKTPFRHDP